MTRANIATVVFVLSVLLSACADTPLSSHERAQVFNQWWDSL